MEKIRLYRAISKREVDGIYSCNNNQCVEKTVDINIASIPDEIYSHTLSSYKVRKGILYSFTDDFAVAKWYLHKEPEKYIAIGYIDIYVNEGEFVIPSSVLFLFRTCEFSDWLRLADLKEDVCFVNKNIPSSPRSIMNALVPGQKSVYSWAKSSREYVAVCNGLKLSIIDANYVEPSWCKKYTKDMRKKDTSFKHYDLFKDVVKKLNITGKRRIFIEKQLDQYAGINES